jgi:hypothetical protein
MLIFIFIRSNEADSEGVDRDFDNYSQNAHNPKWYKHAFEKWRIADCTMRHPSGGCPSNAGKSDANENKDKSTPK